MIFDELSPKHREKLAGMIKRFDQILHEDTLPKDKHERQRYYVCWNRDRRLNDLN